MHSKNDIRFGPLSDSCVHLCVDLQRLFAEDTEWKTPWMDRVLPNVCRITEAHASRTIFTRFVPAERPSQGEGTWKRYWERWSSMTIEALGPNMVELLPELARFVPPAEVVDKTVYSPWLNDDLERRLKNRNVDTIVVTGGETDVCVLATVLGAVDRGLRIIVATDALCSSSDETHDALLAVYYRRYGQQVETATTETILKNWVSS